MGDMSINPHPFLAKLHKCQEGMEMQTKIIFVCWYYAKYMIAIVSHKIKPEALCASAQIATDLAEAGNTAHEVVVARG